MITPILRKAYNSIFTFNGRRKTIHNIRLLKLYYLSNFRKNCPVRYRLKDNNYFIVHCNDHLSLDIYLDRAYEPLESAALRSILKINDIVIDIGANVGYYSALMSSGVGPHGTVYAFEPGLSTYKKLIQTIHMLKLSNVKPFNAAIGESRGVANFFHSLSGDDAQQSLLPREGMKNSKGSAGQVEIISLGDFLFENNVNDVAFLKCDVEGYEVHVLRGAENLLKGDNPPILLIEVNKPALDASNSSVHDLFKLLSGYKLYYTPLAWPSGLQLSGNLIHFTGAPDKLPEIANFFAFPTRGKFAQRESLLKNQNII